VKLEILSVGSSDHWRMKLEPTWACKLLQASNPSIGMMNIKLRVVEPWCTIIDTETDLDLRLSIPT
jgi:hypothetical protein